MAASERKPIFSSTSGHIAFIQLVLEAVQKAEGIEAGPEEVELELVDMSKKYNMELDKLKELLGDAEKESIKKDLEIQKTITMIVNNAQVK